MSDADKTIQNEFRETNGSGAEGVILGCKMFDEFRAGIIASLPKDLSAEEFKKELFRTIYGASMEEFLSGKVTDADIVHENWP
jgi:hypothetical protein